MKISTKGRYALRLMVDLGLRDPEEYTSLKDISQRQDISMKYLEQIVPMLSKAGFLRSTRGAQGGYKLAKAPEEYTVGDIIRVTEGSLAPIACLDDEVNLCDRYSQCATIEFWEGLKKVIDQYVDSTTLQDLLDREKARSGGDYMI